MPVQVVEGDVVRARGLMTGAHGEVEGDPTLALYPAVDDLRTDLAGRVRKVETEVVFLPQVREYLDQEVRPLSRMIGCGNQAGALQRKTPALDRLIFTF